MRKSTILSVAVLIQLSKGNNSGVYRGLENKHQMRNCNVFALNFEIHKRIMWNLGLIHTRYEKHVLNSWKDHTYIMFNSVQVYNT